LVKTNRSTLHTILYNIQQSATQGSNDTTHRLSGRTATRRQSGSRCEVVIAYSRMLSHNLSVWADCDAQLTAHPLLSRDYNVNCSLMRPCNVLCDVCRARWTNRPFHFFSSSKIRQRARVR